MLCIFYGCPPDPIQNEPSCIDGIQNQDETGVDCGGKCIECFDCFSNNCSYLSGGIFSDPKKSIKWKCTLLDGEVFVADEGDITQVILAATRYEFSNKGDLSFTSTNGTFKGRWNFDNPDEPTEIQYHFPNEEIDDFSLDLVSLEENVLELSWYEGAIATFEPY